MRTSGAGKGGAFIAVAGAVALAMTGCSSNSGGAKGNTTDAVQQAAGVGTTSSAPSTSAPAPTPTSAPTSSSATAPSSSSAASTSSSAQSSTSSAHTDPTTKPTSKPSTHPSTPTPTKPKQTTPTSPTTHSGSGWLAGVPLGSNKPGALDPRCTTGRAICIDMSTRTLLWVVNGKVQYGMDVRFGDENNPTRKGSWSINSKMEHCISNLYHTSMPDAMFFSGGEAVHFSIDFATYGYEHHSHGCVNVRDRAAVERLFADTRLGDKVIVY